jgi:nicotinate-nucleotide adenylyltransferase
MRIGVLGGSFDPVHIGHIHIADAAKSGAGLSEVVFMPVNIQPFKMDVRMCEGFHRLEMLRVALSERECFSVSDVELKHTGISYTLISLREIRSGFPDGTEIYFILGMDMFVNLEKWYKSDELFREFGFIVCERPGTTPLLAEACVTKFEKVYGARVIRVMNEALECSSSDIRKRLLAGENADDVLPVGVPEYIRENGLYKQ